MHNWILKLGFEVHWVKIYIIENITRCSSNRDINWECVHYLSLIGKKTRIPRITISKFGSILSGWSKVYWNQMYSLNHFVLDLWMVCFVVRQLIRGFFFFKWLFLILWNMRQIANMSWENLSCFTLMKEKNCDVSVWICINLGWYLWGVYLICHWIRTVRNDKDFNFVDGYFIFALLFQNELARLDEV